MKSLNEIVREQWTGDVSNKEFANCIFNDLVVRKAKIVHTKFNKVKFKNCYLGFDSQYLDCEFESCKFEGRFSSLGRPAVYKNCNFNNCSFVGMDLFTGLRFVDCYFSGKIKNAIFRDEHPTIENIETIFENCDLSNVLFDNISIYGSSVFRNTKYPKNGLRFFRNTEDYLIDRAERICSGINDQSKIQSEIIFSRGSKKGQNPIILDTAFLDKFFKTQESKDIFDQIVSGFEI